ncbi:hypothetical protein RND71_042918 [Anisodus tanguticus]|uniref:mitogen-activated protein kinase kinase kinase n=1 Tax=Anisodus tanguticus TaxID=243964 RepID=A0AAE1QSC5_9SOLA|nr:hypothetical protein RND71_042918 [Anisodus tanguticus]
MRSWWGKSSSKDARRKSNKESFIDKVNRKLKIFTEEKSSGKSGSSRRRHNDTISVKDSQSRVSRSPSPSTPVPRCQSFADRTSSQPLPLPEGHSCYVHLLNSNNSASIISLTGEVSKPSLTLPLPTPRYLPHGPVAAGVDRDLPTASVSCDSSSDSDDLTDSQLLSPQTSDCENGSRTALNSPSSLKQKVQSPIASKASSGEMLKSSNLFSNNQAIPTSPRKRLLSSHVPNLQIPHHGAFYSAPDSSMSSPSRSPMRVFGNEVVVNSGFWLGKPHGEITFLGSGHCSSSGSGQNSGHNSIGGDMSGQPFWPHSRCSPECSPVPSPRMTSPGTGSRIHSGAVTPLHPRAGGASAKSSTASLYNGKQQSHRLPLPPISIPHSSAFSPSYSTAPANSRSPGRTGNPPSPGPRWKKGRLVGRGTFGHVYLGFNSESGEMCAMKEVTLFSDDAKSRESAQQLGQEISLLSRLRHPNIVQYYGSETVDDKLYIYLEYISGGSIYKILQEYGQLGELAIQSYTQQILSGLAYLHAKNTVHRDIKGANILVDPNGRVKLADFGMAKHVLFSLLSYNLQITGQYCPLSFKGSPYWMAPEVIKNSNGCHLAVDIWSLGCTILEMATTKPPWSQYEGIAAIFKIGNSKELPAIPYHLSDEGKDFVRQCLQRNPLRRPTASQLLEHSFVKSATPVERPILSREPVETIPPLMPAVRSVVVGHLKSPPCVDSEGVAVHHQPSGSKILPGFSRGSSGNSRSTYQGGGEGKGTEAESIITQPKMNVRADKGKNKVDEQTKNQQPAEGIQMGWITPLNPKRTTKQQAQGGPQISGQQVGTRQSRQGRPELQVVSCSDVPVPRNISCRVSPVGTESHLLHSQSPKHTSGRLSPSPISSSRAVSGSSTPLSGGGGGAVPLFNSMMPTTFSPEGMGISPWAQSCFYPDGYTGHDLKCDMFHGTSQSHLIRETLLFDTQSGFNGQPYQGQSVLANRVAQQLLRDQVKLSPSFDLNPGSPVFGRNNGVCGSLNKSFGADERKKALSVSPMYLFSVAIEPHAAVYERQNDRKACFLKNGGGGDGGGIGINGDSLPLFEFSSTLSKLLIFTGLGAGFGLDILTGSTLTGGGGGGGGSPCIVAMTLARRWVASISKLSTLFDLCFISVFRGTLRDALFTFSGVGAGGGDGGDVGDNNGGIEAG